ERLRLIVGSLLFGAAATNISAQSTPFENLDDPCGYPAVIPTQYGPPVSRLLEAETMLINSTQIEPNPLAPGFYHLKNTRPFTSRLTGDGAQQIDRPLCPNAPFANEQQ